MPAAGYREYLAGPRLGAVQCFWTSSMPKPTGALAHRVLPDGCMDLLFDFAPDAPLPVRIVGTMTRALVVESRGVSDFLGIRFRPGGLPALVRMDAAELRDGDADPACFGGRFALDLWHRLAEAAPPARPAILCETLPAATPDPLVAWCASRIEARCGQLAIAALADESGAGARRIERSFARQVGIAPKQLARITRFRGLIAAAEAGEGSWADLAARFGYADQPHMVREFRALAGLSPTEFLAGRPVGNLQDAARRAA